MIRYIKAQLVKSIVYRHNDENIDGIKAAFVSFSKAKKRRDAPHRSDDMPCHQSMIFLVLLAGLKC